MKGSVYQGKRRRRIAPILLTGLLAVLAQTGIAHAGHSACRTDPEVTLSNGDVVAIVADIGTATNSITVAANTTVAAHSQHTYTHTSNGHTNQNVKVDLDAH